MKKKKMRVKISELRQGPIRHDILPVGFIVRVQKYKEILQEVEKISLEETISNFQRDLHPERELAVWEAIADGYGKLLKDNSNLELSQKKDLFGELLSASIG